MYHKKENSLSGGQEVGFTSLESPTQKNVQYILDENSTSHPLVGLTVGFLRFHLPALSPLLNTPPDFTPTCGSISPLNVKSVLSTRSHPNRLSLDAACCTA